MKGYKLIARAAHENARMKNKDKDKLGGKEWKPGWEKSPEYRRTEEENLVVVLPKNIGPKTLSKVRKFLFGRA